MMLLQEVVRVINDSNEEVEILRVLSASVDFRHNDFDLIQLSGSWARERHIVRTPLRSQELNVIESRRGASSHAQNPFIALISNGCEMKTMEKFMDLT